MTRATALESIIRVENSRRPANLAENQARIFFDVAQGSILDRRPKVWRSIIGSTQITLTYIVSTTDPITHDAGKKQLSCKNSDEGVLEIEISCKLQCLAGNQADVVRALAGETSPETRLNELISNAFDSLVETELDENDPLRSFFFCRKKLELELANRLNEETGLETEVRLTVVGEDNIASEISVDTDFFQSFVPSDRDVHIMINIQSELALGVQDSDRITAIVHQNVSSEKIAEDIVKAVKRWFPVEVKTLTNVYKGVVEDEVPIEARALHCVEEIAQTYGRQVGNFQCQVRKPFPLDMPGKIEVVHKTSTTDGTTPVTLTHELIMGISDVSKLRAAKLHTSAAVKRWVQTKLNQISEEVVVGRSIAELSTSYSEVLQLAPPTSAPLDDGIVSKPAPIKEQIQEKLAYEASKNGMRVKHFSSQIDLQCDPALLSSSIVNMEQPCALKEWPKDVLIIHTFRLRPVNLQKYQAARIPNVEEEAKRLLKEITEGVLFTKDYIDVVTNFSERHGTIESDRSPNQPLPPSSRLDSKSYEVEIKNQFRDQLQRIGFEVDQFVSVANTEIQEMIEGFRESDEETFSTSDSREQVQLKIVINGHLPEDLSSIKDRLRHHLDPDEPLKSKMLAVAVRAVAEVLDNVSPFEFYLQFRRLDIDIPTEGGSTSQRKIPVADQLSEVIRLQLNKQFGLTPRHCSVSVNPINTNITQWFSDICGQEDDVTFLVKPYNFSPLTFTLSYRIKAIVPLNWERLVQLARSTSVTDAKNRISETVGKAAKGLLDKQYERNEIEFTQSEQRSLLQKLLTYGMDKTENIGLLHRIADMYGVAIDIYAIVRDSSVEEDTETDITRANFAARTRVTEIRNRHRLNHLEKHYGKLEEMQQEAERRDPDEIESVLSQINQLEEQVGVSGEDHSMRKSVGYIGENSTKADQKRVPLKKSLGDVSTRRRLDFGVQDHDAKPEEPPSNPPSEEDFSKDGNVVDAESVQKVTKPHEDE